MDTIGPLTQQIHNDLLDLIGERSEDYAAEAEGVTPMLERAGANMRVGAEAGVAPVQTIDTGITVH